MLRLFLITFSIISKLFGAPFVENTDFDDKIAEIVEQHGGDPTFLEKFLLKSGDPKGLRNRNNYQSPSFCFGIKDKVIFDEKYTDCLELEGDLPNKNMTVLELGKFSPLGIFKFATNLISLKNVEVKLKNYNELVYLYFSAFETCDNCLFNLVENQGLCGIKFGHLLETGISAVPENHRPKLFIRGNPTLIFNGEKRRMINEVCHKKMSEIQRDHECVFRKPVRNDDQYKSCKSVYGNMTFNSRFQKIQPEPTNFMIDGCFVFNNTGIRFIRPFLRAIATCRHQHVFENNRYMCTDQLNELIRHWGKNKVKVISKYSDVNCYQGECRGGLIAENKKHRYVGCEIVQGDVFLTKESGNVSNRIGELSYVHHINGRLQLADNPTLITLALPFLRHIRSEKCPALLISNMANLRNIIFHPNVEFHCNSSGPVVVIRNTPKLYLYSQVLRQMTDKSYKFGGFDYKLSNYGLDPRTWLLLAFSLVIVAFAELFLALRNAFLLPNVIYRWYPMRVQEKEKPPKTLVNDSDSEPAE